LTTETKYKLVDYDGGLEAHPVREPTGQLRLVGSWWELHFKHVKVFVNGELSDYVLEALPVDRRSCLVSIREPAPDEEILCTFLLPNTPADRFMRDLDHNLHELQTRDDAEGAESHDSSTDHDRFEPADFQIRMNALVGQQLELRSRSRSYELCSNADQQVALFDLSGVSGDLVRLVCAEGSWCLNKRRKYGWELVIESSDGQHTGWYSGHGLLPGGTILLPNDVQIDLRRVLRGRKLEVRETGERILHIRGNRPPCTLTIHSMPAPIYSQAVVATLTTCAVMLLEDMIPMPAVSGGGG
jgi:hypothetical protein